MKIKTLMLVLITSIQNVCIAQKDTLTTKITHAEPLYVDLIRDLGARKGEKEWNVGLGLTDKTDYDSYEALIEYEWAPIDRLGLEIELPFSFYSVNKYAQTVAPSNKLNSLKLAAQYTFLVNTKFNTSMAIGYINELELAGFNDKSNYITGNVYNPFLVMAKKWGTNLHTLIYTGPKFIHHFDTNHLNTVYDLNTNIHYMVGSGRNFVGLEFNKTFHKKDFEMVIRPQMRLEINSQLMLGIVTGIPISKQNERFSSFLRLIYEPKH